MKNQKKDHALFASGFTLIELLVVIAIIGLLASVIIVGLYNSRVSSRNTKRVGDMTQLGSALELYHNTYFGYPAATILGVPNGLAPQFTASLPVAPIPADGTCDTTPNPAGQPANGYYYAPAGASQVVGGITVYTSYNYYFCISGKVGDITSGLKTLTPNGIR